MDGARRGERGTDATRARENVGEIRTDRTDVHDAVHPEPRERQEHDGGRGGRRTVGRASDRDARRELEDVLRDADGGV